MNKTRNIQRIASLGNIKRIKPLKFNLHNIYLQNMLYLVINVVLHML